MATPEAQEAAAKDRIISHMNADHGDSISRYLEAAEKKWFQRYRNARMTDINVNEMKFDNDGKQSVIPFDPPMKSLREARERLVQMDQDALSALGRSNISITTYIPPWANKFHLLNFTVCFTTYVVFARASNFKPGSTTYDNLLYRFPSFSEFCLAIQPKLFAIMVAIHTIEVFIMIRKLQRHGVSLYSRVFWLWVGSCFVEGFTSFNRLNGFILQKEKEKEAKKH